MCRLATSVGQFLSLLRPVPPHPPIALKLSTNGGFVASKHLSYLRWIMSCFHQRINLVSFFLGTLRDVLMMPLILAGTKGHDTTAACLLFRLYELHLRIESALELTDPKRRGLQ